MSDIQNIILQALNKEEGVTVIEQPNVDGERYQVEFFIKNGARGEVVALGLDKIHADYPAGFNIAVIENVHHFMSGVDNNTRGSFVATVTAPEQKLELEELPAPTAGDILEKDMEDVLDTYHKLPQAKRIMFVSICKKMLQALNS